MLPAPPEDIALLLERPVAIFGGGVSGQGVLSLLAEIGGVGVVYDEKDASGAGSFTPDSAGRHRLVVFRPGFAPGHPWFAIARAAGCVCLGELDFASLFWRGDLVAITGTNGKTTLTEFLSFALNGAGRHAQVTGNVGYPFSRFVVEQTGRADIAVCEVSSFQAETLQHLQPGATLWTNFAEDHLERHAGLPAYFTAKWRLLERTAPAGVFVGTSVQKFADQFGQPLPASARVASEGQPADPRLAGTIFAQYPQRENFLLAAAWWCHAGLPDVPLYGAARNFQLAKHRLTRVGERGGVTFWNDSKATNFHAVEAALGTFRDPVLWIGGGKSKGGDLAAFAGRIASRIRHAYLIGETRSALLRFLSEARVPATACLSLQAAVESAYHFASAGDQVLLSPGFASFDMFSGYDDRGRQFEAIVENL